MKYEKAVAVVVEFDNSDVVTESPGADGVITTTEAQQIHKDCNWASLDLVCGSDALNAMFWPS